MLKSLRKKLTIFFACTSLVIYVLSVCFAGLIFSSGLNSDLYNNLSRLIDDIQPSVHIEDGKPTLRDWAANARAQHLKIIHVVQLYDRNKQLLEEYGRPGEHQLCNGQVDGWGLKHLHHFASSFVPIGDVGYLQLQEDQKQTADAVNRFYISMFLILPVLVLGAAVGGYYYAGYAVAPVAQNLKVLRQFVADAGHELNTPTTIIEASVQTLEDSLADKPEMSLIAAIGRASQRLRNLAANLVFLARLESAEVPFHMERLNVDSLVAQVTEDFEEIAREKKIDLYCKTSSQSYVSGDSEAVHRMLANLISNAIRYTESGGSINVTAGKGESGTAVIAVEDTGVGISENCVKLIFDRFYRIDNSRSRDGGGTGLGLSIVKAIVEAHNGTIKVESQVGKGSIFIVTMPSSNQVHNPGAQTKNVPSSA